MQKNITIESVFGDFTLVISYNFDRMLPAIVLTSVNFFNLLPISLICIIGFFLT